MRREVLLRSITRVLSDLDETAIPGYIRSIVQTRNTEKVSQIDLNIVLNYIQRTTSYSDTEWSILEILNLSDLSNVAFWQTVLNKPEQPLFYDVYSSLSAAETFLPRMANLLRREFDDVGSPDGKVLASADGLDKQTVILTDEDGDLQSSPDRLIQVLQSISVLYDTIAQILGIETGPIAVVGMDSGSEKSFDFLGIEGIIKEIRETLLVVFNTITFHSQNRHQEI